MDKKEILRLVEEAAHIGERYGAASIENDTAIMNQLRDKYQRLIEDVKILLEPPQWGVGSIAAQQQARTPTAAMMQQLQMAQQQQYVHRAGQALFDDPWSGVEDPEPPIEIEFSL
jgi:hypothetical protein